MPHLHTEPGQHDLTVSAYIVIRHDGAEPALLLHRHKKLNKYLQFGGHVELHEDPWRALTHELAEESGYAISQLKLLQPILRVEKLSSATLHPYPVNLLTHKFGELEHFHTDIAYAFTTQQTPQGSIDDGESTDTEAFTSKELVALSPEEIPENVREIGLFVLDRCLDNWTEVDASIF